ncbi:hypothetical protein BY996DRAFT_6512214 [Phakopsora pachyrhizi]|nr:hypothetical protein BY996DRAFT_6512214 [Phakopsora pachyrhizi]
MPRQQRKNCQNHQNLATVIAVKSNSQQNVVSSTRKSSEPQPPLTKHSHQSKLTESSDGLKLLHKSSTSSDGCWHLTRYLSNYILKLQMDQKVKKWVQFQQQKFSDKQVKTSFVDTGKQEMPLEREHKERHHKD